MAPSRWINSIEHISLRRAWLLILGVNVRKVLCTDVSSVFCSVVSVLCSVVSVLCNDVSVLPVLCLVVPVLCSVLCTACESGGLACNATDVTAAPQNRFGRRGWEGGGLCSC